MAQWKFQLAGRELGPIEARQLASMALDGRLQPEDLVRRNDREDWIAASQVQGLKFPDDAPPPLPAAGVDIGRRPSAAGETLAPPRNSTRRKTWSIAAAAIALVGIGAGGWLYLREDVPRQIKDEAGVFEVALPAELDAFQLKTALDGTFADDGTSPTLSFTFSGGSWRAQGTGGRKESGVFDVVLVDDTGKLSPTGRAGYALLLSRLVVDDPVTILPVRAYLGTSGKVERLELTGLAEGPLGPILGARRLVLRRGPDAPSEPGPRFSRPFAVSETPPRPQVASATPTINTTRPISPTPSASPSKSVPSTDTIATTIPAAPISTAPTSSATALPILAKPTASPPISPPIIVASAPSSATTNMPSMQSPVVVTKPSQPGEKSGIKFTLIPAAEFWMGSAEQDRQSDPSEKPRRRVRLTKDFYLSTCEVTVGQFRKFVEATDYQTTVEKNKLGGWKANWSTSKGKRDPQCTWRNPGFAQTEEHPVVVVSWEDAAAYCKWLSSIEGMECRLPTEAEWEYACRAGSEDVRHSGSEALTNFAWLSNNSGATTHPIGLLKPNPFGLHDTYGNVREWCLDRYQAPYASLQNATDPTGPAVGSQRSWRGGSWQDGSSFVRSAKRGGYLPEEALNNLGFRVARLDKTP